MTYPSAPYIGLVDGYLESYFDQLKLSQPLFSLKLTKLTLTANPPTVIGQKLVSASIN